MNPFDELIKQLSQQLGIPLKTDNNQSCRINFEQGFDVQLELDNDAENIWMGCELPVPPPGLLKERIYRAALMYNGLTPLPHPFFAFSEKKGSLVLLESLVISTLNNEKFFQQFQSFISAATNWHEALTTGRYHLIETTSTEKGSRPFGLNS